MPHALGATLRLLRVDAGISLRDLARRIGVSNAYLSRVEHGLDAPPTAERLSAIARELDIPLTLLLDVGQRVSPFLASYLDEVPEAGTLFLEIARRGLGPDQLARVRAFIDAEMPARTSARGLFGGGGRVERVDDGLAPLLANERVVLGLDCAHIGDALDVAASRLSRAAGCSAHDLALRLRRSEEDASGSIGHGLLLARAFAPCPAPLAAIVVLGRPIAGPPPGAASIRAVVVLVSDRRSGENLARLAHVARLGARGLAKEIAGAKRPAQVITKVLELERVR